MAGADADLLAKARICAANNVDLYECVFRAHGLDDERTASHWQSSAEAPPYYSNFVTLAPEAAQEQLAAVDRLDSAIGRSFTLKDAFAALPLAERGFTLLFEAQWIWLEVSATPVAPEPGWERISAPRELALWEDAWNGTSPAGMRIFPPSTLADADVGFFGKQQNGHYVAGCIANRSHDCVGFSNFFAPSESKVDCMTSAVSAVAGFGGGLPVVGYERGEDLEMALAAGFQSVGRLRVWVRQR